MATTKHTYTEAVGRRKTASARVRIMAAKAISITVNGKDAADYFPLKSQMKMIYAPLEVLGAVYAVSAKVAGGGLNAQAEAIRHGLSRAITELVPTQRKDLKVKGFLTRDQRGVERKKFGLKSARRAPQWSKR
jgi:small subunit ribosomal protein S9